MGLDLYHHMAVDPSHNGLDGFTKENISDFPVECKAKFESFIFYELVSYIDWDATGQKLFKLSPGEFIEHFKMTNECYSNVQNEVFQFQEMNSKNGNSFTIKYKDCEYIEKNEPHLIVKVCGGQRGGMKEEFFKHYDNFQFICCLKQVVQMLKFCTTAEVTESFISNFITNWTPESFLTISSNRGENQNDNSNVYSNRYYFRR